MLIPLLAHLSLFSFKCHLLRNCQLFGALQGKELGACFGRAFGLELHLLFDLIVNLAFKDVLSPP
jgi:hypothetical protein